MYETSQVERGTLNEALWVGLGAIGARTKQLATMGQALGDLDLDLTYGR